ncbi:hypothetical protein ACPOL_0267 [Acidisarcina polymorpha]|uniref:Uncharacterized protein n=1 Tax=Acidisarcina polymorpha TaxID=2211140 RepID=A0A2Z5FS87_9BACT|nr:hypothetical protein ACPOL_0267 [Acidisarcina polymorpha]
MIGEPDIAILRIVQNRVTLSIVSNNPEAHLPRRVEARFVV